MKRGPIVLAATAAGVAGVLSFHTRSSTLTGGGGAALGAGASAGAPSGSTTTTSPPAGGTSGTSSSTSTTSPASTPSTTRSATGVQVNYNYGILAVSVTVAGKKITHVKIASIDEGGNQLSQSIDQQSIPMLEQETLQAQTSNIQSISGASYTSAGFIQSLQSALGKLGLK
jgi:uncharacterized protein with FMN-binding domain